MFRQLRRLCSHTYRVTLNDANELSSLKEALNGDSKLLMSHFSTEAGVAASAGSRLDSPLSSGEDVRFPLEVEFMSPVGVQTEALHAVKNTFADRQKELLYAMANFQNLQRTQKAELDHKSAKSVKLFAQSLLPFLDQLEIEARGAERRLSSDHAFVQGIQLTHENALKSLSKFDICKFEPQQGDVFVKNKHEEVETVASPAADDADTVESVKVHGWMIQNDVLRKADVAVYRNERPE